MIAKPLIDNRGLLLPIEFKDLPFVPKRLFFVTDVPCDTKRGDHSHYKTKQLLICVNGKIEVNLFDGIKWSSTIITKAEHVFVDQLIWDNQIFLDECSSLLVLCSTEYDENDYITDMEQFKQIVKRK